MKLRTTFRYVGSLLLVPALAFLASAQTPLTPVTVYSFKNNASDVGLDSVGYGVMAQGRDGNIWGAGATGGANSDGGIYAAATTGSESLKHSFASSEGTQCQPGLNAGTDGNLYGVCTFGGANGYGSIYQISTSGTFKVIYNFTNGTDSQFPNGPPIMSTDGNLYGTAGTNTAPGIVYKLTTKGVITVLHTFTTSDAAGYGPSAPLVHASDGNFYGSTQFGASSSNGALFKITSTGTLTVLHTFSGTDGSRPIGGMVQGTDGNLYGTTYTGGANGDGVLFKVTTGGTYTVMHNFAGGADGANPTWNVIQATDGSFYGTTSDGQTSTNAGTIYKLTSKGVYSVVYDFPGGSTGSNPNSGLIQDTNGSLYGVTLQGGTAGAGDLYSLNIGASAFVTLVTTSGSVGTKVGILGQGFSSSTVVKFGGVQATTVTLTGTTYLTATVPAGATNGYVTVTTGSTTLTSTQKFTVHNSWSSGAPMTTATWSPAAVGLLSGSIYFVGGRLADGTTTNAVQIYNPTTNVWSTGTSMPTPTAEGNGAVLNNVLYVFGGTSLAQTCNGSVTNAVWAYTASTKVWTSKAAMPTARCDAGVVVLNGISYVIGGFDGTSAIDTVESYNPTTNTWTEEAPLLGIKNGASVGVSGTTIIASGGYIDNGFTGDTESYNSKTNAWSELTADTTQRNAACYGMIGSDLYVAGGSTTNGAINVTESFVLSTDKWTTLAAQPTAVLYAGSAVSGGQLYCMGGTLNYLGTTVTNVQIYQP